MFEVIEFCVVSLSYLDGGMRANAAHCQMADGRIMMLLGTAVVVQSRTIPKSDTCFCPKVLP